MPSSFRVPSAVQWLKGTAAVRSKPRPSCHKAFASIVLALSSALVARSQGHAAFSLTANQGRLPFSADAATVIHLTGGPNWVDLHGDGRKQDLVVLARRENFNAHGFWVVTIYMQARERNAGWQIVPWFDPRQSVEKTEQEEITTSQGADCVLHDLRLVQVKEKARAQVFLLQGDRVFGEGFADTQPVSFDVYRLKRNEEGEAGLPLYYFEYETTVRGKGKYCDINKAFKSELNLADYMDREP